MNEQERAELERLKQTQSELLARLADLGRKIVAFETRLKDSEKVELTKAAVPQPPQDPPEPKLEWVSPPPPIPPVITPVMPPAPVPVSAVEKLLERRDQPAPAPTPAPIIPPAPAQIPPPLPVPAAPVVALKAEPPPLPPKPPTLAPPLPPRAPVPAKGSFEMRLGTFWLVRVGIIMVLTGLVFFATYAYHNYIGKLGAGGKVALLYVASGLLLGAGAWLQRKEEKLRNYAQVLLAGGLAAVYFTTYAAHHIPTLQVITNATLDGGLLLGWAAFMIWVSDRKKSEVMAFFAILLAYYTSAITHVGLFTLYSNLLLAAAAVFFLVRNRWAALSFASLTATYAGYSFWRFYQDGQWRLVSPEEGLWTGVYFLLGYWVIFTAAVFLSKHEQFADRKRAAFLTLNNAAFFSTFLLTMAQVHNDRFWQFSLTCGVVFLALSALSRWLLPSDRMCANAYLTQGVLLVTVGFVARYSGLNLGIILGVESFILVIVGQQMKSRVLQAGSIIVAALSALWVIGFVHEFDRQGLIAGTAVGALLLLDAFWLRRETDFDKSLQHPRTLCFTILALATWLVTTWRNTHPEWQGLVLGAESVVFLFTAALLVNRVLIFGSYAFAGVAVLAELVRLFDQMDTLVLAQRTGLLPAVILGALMIVNAVHEQRRLKAKDDGEIQPPVTFFSLAAMAAWLTATWVFTPREYVAPLLATEAALLTAAFYPLRIKELALFGQGFLVFAQCVWLYDSVREHATRLWWNPATVIVVTLALAAWWQRQKSLVLKPPTSSVFQGLYALAVVALVYFWLQPHFAAPGWLAFTSVLAIAATAYGALTRQWLLAAFGQIFLLASAWEFSSQLWDGKPEWYFALVPMAAACALSLCAVKWLEAHDGTKTEIRDTVLQVGLVYRVVAVAMSLWWLHKYIPAREQCWVAVAVGLALFLAAGWRRNNELLIFSGVFALAGVLRFWLPWDGTETVYLPNLLAILILAAEQQFAQRTAKRYTAHVHVHTAVMLIAGLSTWLLLSRWILQFPDKSYLTAGWSVLALVMFMVGMTLRERVYRWQGLAILTCALGRIIIIDVWRLETIYRILSFMALGIVLLVLGFIYNKYQEKLREWL